MIGKVSEITPKITYIENGDVAGGNSRLWQRNVLYNTHELYLLGYKSSGAPLLGSVENISPNLYSVINE